MPRPPSFYHPLRDIRKLTDTKTQADFAELVGVAAPTIQAIENGKFEISRKLALRIERTTGVDHRELLKGSSGKPLAVDGKKYSRDFYECWIEQLNSAPENSLSGSMQQLGFWTRLLIRAAGNESSKNRQRASVVHLLTEALDSVCQDCDLEQAVEHLLTPMKKVEYHASTPKRWIEGSTELGKSLDTIAPRFHPSARVVIAMERIPRWAPGHPVPGNLLGNSDKTSTTS